MEMQQLCQISLNIKYKKFKSLYLIDNKMISIKKYGCMLMANARKLVINAPNQGEHAPQ